MPAVQQQQQQQLLRGHPPIYRAREIARWVSFSIASEGAAVESPVKLSGQDVNLSSQRQHMRTRERLAPCQQIGRPRRLMTQ